MKVRSQTVYLPHLHYAVRFRPFKAPPNAIRNAKAWVRSDDKFCCTVYLPNSESPSQIAHELVHVLWFICRDRHMNFEDEFEHMAYLMQYLMGRALGRVWKND